MFYAHFVLAKKGPLAKIWLAAHWDKKLTKAHVFETNIEKSVDGILKPKVKMALRTSGHLLLGVVRIYSRKAKYLLADCNEAFVKIKMAFRPGMVDLPEEHREAAMNAITLPEVFHDFDTAMPELNEVDIEAQFSLNQSRAEEITMREDYGSLNLVPHDDGFGDMGFDTEHPDIMREAIGHEGHMEQSNLLFAEGSSLELTGKEPAVAGPSQVPQMSEASESRPQMEAASHGPIDDGFGGTIGDVADFGHAGGLFEGDLFGDVSAGGSGAGTSSGMPGSSAPPQSLQAEIEAAQVNGSAEAAQAQADADSDDDMGHFDAGASPAHSWDGSQHGDIDMEPPVDKSAELMPPPSVPRPPSPHPMEVEEMPAPEEAAEAAEPPDERADHDNTTLLHNDEESFALAPVDTTALKGITKSKRKRKLIVDEVKNISGEEMKNQLSNTLDIVTTLDLAPPTRRLMHWKESGGVEKLFTLPARPIPSSILFKKYQRNMIAKLDSDEAEPEKPDAVRRAKSPEPETTVRRSGRKRKHEEIMQPPETPAPEMEPQTPALHEYEPSAETVTDALREQEPATPGFPMTPGSEDQPHTPGMLSSLGPPLTPSVLGPLTPGTLLQGGLTPGGLPHGGMTPAGLQHGGMTPAGLHHGGMTPGGLAHGVMTPAGLEHGGDQPNLGGMTPARGGMTPSGVHGGMMTPLHHMDGGMTPAGLGHGGLTPAGLHHGGMTPGGLEHVGMLQQGMDDMPMMPHLPGDQVSSLLGEASGVGGGVGVSAAGVPPSHELDHTVPMEPLPMHALDSHAHYTGGMQMANLGYDENQGGQSPSHDYDLPPSVENQEESEREAGETEAQWEERVMNRRAAQLLAVMRPRLAGDAQLTFSSLAPHHNNRKQVAQKFYSLLVLKKYQVVTLSQEETYGPITVAKGVKFETEVM